MPGTLRSFENRFEFAAKRTSGRDSPDWLAQLPAIVAWRRSRRMEGMIKSPSIKIQKIRQASRAQLKSTVDPHHSFRHLRGGPALGGTSQVRRKDSRSGTTVSDSRHAARAAR